MFPIAPAADEKKNQVIRYTTDLGCGCLFTVTVGCMVALSVLGFFIGDTKRLTHGLDYNGRLCGEGQMANKSYLYYCGFLERNGDYPKSLNYHSKSCVETCPNSTEDKIACVLPEFVNTTMLGAGKQNNLTFDSTFDIQITQSVVYQTSYPTELHLGRYCVPKQTSENDLYSRVLNGPLKKVTQINDTVQSFKRGWPVVLTLVILAIGLGLAYLLVLKRFAGILIFISLWCGTVLTGLGGLFFSIGIFFDPYNELGWYQQSSPCFLLTPGPEARVWSAFIGAIFFMVCGCMYISVKNEKIDESIGIIYATVDCIMGSSAGASFLVQPLTQACLGTFLTLVLFYGGMLIYSISEIDHNFISMNGLWVPKEPYARELMAKEVHPWYWQTALTVYVVGAVWFMLTLFAFFQFVIIYAVCDWFFLENTLEDNPEAKNLPAALAKRKGKSVKVNTREGGKRGYMTTGVDGTQVVHVQDPGRIPDKIAVKQKLPLCIMTKGIFVGLRYHLGTIALAGPAIVAFAPFRALSEVLKTFAGVGEDDEEGLDQERWKFLLFGGFRLLATLLDETCGRYSVTMLADVVLRSTNFSTASNDAYDFILDAGGAVALLHGVTNNFATFGAIIITLFCALLSEILLETIPVFSNTTSNLYVPSPGMMTLVVAILAWGIGTSFLSLFTMSADTLLFTFAYARDNYAENLSDFLPGNLQPLVQNEIEVAPTLVLQPQSRNQWKRLHHTAAKYTEQLTTSVHNSIKQMRGTSEGTPLLSTGGLRH